MNPDPRYLVVVLVALIAALVVLILGRPNRLFSSGRRAVPKHLEVIPISDDDIPDDAKVLVRFLGERLTNLGFANAGPVSQIVGLDTSHHRCLLVSFVHVEERALLLTAIETCEGERSDLMLHICTKMGAKKRVETSTLAALSEISAPSDTELELVTEADSIDEIWSRHRRALTSYERAERTPIQPEEGLATAQEIYEAWSRAGLRAQRLKLNRSGDKYVIRRRPRSTV